jgi:hypothetical protein
LRLTLCPEEATRRAPRLATLQETGQRQIAKVEYHVGAEGWRAEAEMIIGTPGELTAEGQPAHRGERHQRDAP